jgi:chaperonin GroEL
MNKKTLYGAEARAKLLSGVKKIAAAVKVTLGPMGRNVLISQSMVIDYGIHNLPIHITKDGYTTTRAFEINDDPFEQAGVLMIKEAAQKSVDQAGDGTTTTVVLAEAIVAKAIESIDKGANPVELKRSIDKGVLEVVAQLKAMATPIKGNIDRIRQIATISANNDAEMGGLIADAFAKIGEEGIIDLEAGQSVSTEIRIAQGYKWEKSWVSPHFINNKEKQICEFENPAILLYDKKITHHTQILRTLELINKHGGRPLLIVCEDAEGEGLATLAINTLQQRFKICIVKAPEFNEKRREAMEDIAMLTGASYVSDIRGIDIKEVEWDHFGHAEKVLVTRDETIIIGGRGNKEGVENLLNELQMNLAIAKNEDEKYPIERRIAKLKGGVAVISVGAATETEMKEKLDRFDDAVRAVKAALSEGYIVGGGTAFLRIQTSSDIINDILSVPLLQICNNSGVEAKAWSITMDVKASAGNIGYNAKTNSIENLIDAGVIDPVKVLRCAITNAASSAGMIITTEALICDTM